MRQKEDQTVQICNTNLCHGGRYLPVQHLIKSKTMHFFHLHESPVIIIAQLVPVRISWQSQQWDSLCVRQRGCLMFNSLINLTAQLQTTADHAASVSNWGEVHECWRHFCSKTTSKSFYPSREWAEAQPTEMRYAQRYREGDKKCWNTAEKAKVKLMNMIVRKMGQKVNVSEERKWN